MSGSEIQDQSFENSDEVPLWQIDQDMQVDIEQLRDFYATPRGQVVRRLIAARVRARWTNVNGASMFGIGYPVPYLDAYRSEVHRLGALMPSTQGALIWPTSGLKQVILIDEEQLPLPDNSADFLLVVHGLEMMGHVRHALREMWRILAPEGRIIIVVPNRRGIWARTESTPFGSGQPYTRRQLDKLLTNAMFTPLDYANAIYLPPFNRDMLLRTAVGCERLGSLIVPAFGGVIIVEARKELTAPVGKLHRARILSDLIPGRVKPVPSGAARSPTD